MKSIQRGSITVEVVVMLGLISALTPLLYKQVSDRRRDIDNINEANKLLLLKEATKDYIKANKDILLYDFELVLHSKIKHYQFFYLIVIPNHIYSYQ